MENKSGRLPVLMRLTINGKRWDSALIVELNPDDWDANKEKATGDDSRDQITISG
jgi:hypothetical protein